MTCQHDTCSGFLPSVAVLWLVRHRGGYWRCFRFICLVHPVGMRLAIPVLKTVAKLNPFPYAFALHYHGSRCAAGWLTFAAALTVLPGG